MVTFGQTTPLHQAMLLATQARDMIPLHASCVASRGRAAGILLVACPVTAQVLSSRHGLPLHCACANGCLEAVRALLKVHPEAVRGRDWQHGFPLHQAATQGNVDVIQALLSVWREGARQRSIVGSLPLHHAAVHHHLQAVKALIAAWPQGARQYDTYGRLPVDVALCSSHEGNSDSDATVDTSPVVQVLLDAWPECYEHENSSGQLMLHRLVAKHGMNHVAAVTAVMRAYPKALWWGDHRGDVPLMTALRNDAGPDVVKALLEAYPEAVRRRNNVGEVALHCCAGHTDRTVVEALLAVWPDAATCTARTGNTPSVAVR